MPGTEDSQSPDPQVEEAIWATILAALEEDLIMRVKAINRGPETIRHGLPFIGRVHGKHLFLYDFSQRKWVVWRFKRERRYSFVRVSFDLSPRPPGKTPPTSSKRSADRKPNLFYIPPDFVQPSNHADILQLGLTKNLSLLLKVNGNNIQYLTDNLNRPLPPDDPNQSAGDILNPSNLPDLIEMLVRWNAPPSGKPHSITLAEPFLSLLNDGLTAFENIQQRLRDPLPEKGRHTTELHGLNQHLVAIAPSLGAGFQLERYYFRMLSYVDAVGEVGDGKDDYFLDVQAERVSENTLVLDFHPWDFLGAGKVRLEPGQAAVLQRTFRREFRRYYADVSPQDLRSFMEQANQAGTIYLLSTKNRFMGRNPRPARRENNPLPSTIYGWLFIRGTYQTKPAWLLVYGKFRLERDQGVVRLKKAPQATAPIQFTAAHFQHAGTPTKTNRVVYRKFHKFTRGLLFILWKWQQGFEEPT